MLLRLVAGPLAALLPFCEDLSMVLSEWTRGDRVQSQGAGCLRSRRMPLTAYLRLCRVLPRRGQYWREIHQQTQHAVALNVQV